MKFILTKRVASAETDKIRHRMLVERQWVRSLLRMCRSKIDPDDFQRWLKKYEDDCRWLRNSDVPGNS